MASMKDALTKGLVSMKRKKEEVKKLSEPCESLEDTYPYGTRLNLQKDQIEALGLDLTDLKVGGEMVMVAKVSVESVRMSEGKSSYSRELSLQITDMKLTEEK